MSINTALSCHICNSAAITIFDSFSELGRATSDCTPWPKGGQLAICSECSIVQKIVDPQWRTEVKAIYAKYNLFHQSATNNEQPVFDSITGKSAPRSEVILNYAQSVINLDTELSIMDIGCGIGNTLRSIGKHFTTAKLYGFEPNPRDMNALQTIPNIVNIYTDTKQFSEKSFDLVTMIHVLEHIDAPLPVMQSLRSALGKDGYLVIGVPNYKTNPFDLIIADHASHYTLDTLSNLLKSSGFEVIAISDTVINKELVAVCKASEVQSNCLSESTYDPVFVQRQLDWMTNTVAEAKAIAAKSRPFGIFGTSIAANWLYGILEAQIEFFVDEDKDRTERLYHNKPVYHTSGIPQDSHTFVCLQPNVVDKIIARISEPHFFLHPTPSF
jgi:2-polyprenyl-3-methyl-5-hydroxy-6-metoxy-1,4-benzoquinol methylase